MPAIWPLYDDQRLPNPKDNPGDGGGKTEDHGPAGRLQMNWFGPHTPTPPTRTPPASDKPQATGKGGDSGKGGHDDDTDPDKADPDVHYLNPSHLPDGTLGRSIPPDYDRLEVAVDDLTAYEQGMLAAASAVVAQFNSLRDRTQNIRTDPMWGRGEGHWYLGHPVGKKQPGQDNADRDPKFLLTNSALAARDFTDAIGPAQQGALQGAAGMIMLSGMFIEMLDATITSYAQMDMLAVFPDLLTLKTMTDQKGGGAVP